MVVLAIAGGVSAALGGARPTDVWLVDVVYVGAAGAGLVFAGGRSRRTSWLLSSVAALWLASGTPGRIAAIVAIGLAVHAARTGRRRALGAGVGAALAFVLGDLGAGPFHGSTTLLAAIAAAPMAISGLHLLPPERRRGVGLAASIGLGIAASATLVFGVAVVWAMADVSPGVDAAEQAFDLAGDGDEPGAAAAFDRATEHFDDARGKISGFWTLPARLVPVVGQHVQAVQVVASEGVGLSDTAADTARTVDPEEIRFTDGRLDLEAMEDLTPALERAERALGRAEERITEARTPWLLEPVERRLTELITELADARPAAHTAALAAREVPAMLGGAGPVDWLVAVTTPAEARGLGGLVGNWVVARADDGEIGIVDSGRNEDVNERLRTVGAELRGPQQYLDRWGRFTPEVFFQDVTLTPDLPMAAAVMADLFDQAMGTSIDGVVVVDPFAVAAILDLTGPVQTSQIRLGADSVAPFLLEEQYRLDEADRVRVLEELIEGTFERLTGGELPGPAGIAATLAPVVDQDRLGIWWRADDGARVLIDDLSLDGRFPDPGDGDLLAVVHQNAGQNKIDVHLRRRIGYDLEVTDGRADATITVTLVNEVPSLDLPLAVVGNNDQGYPLGTNVALVTVHTALELREARLDGGSHPVERAKAFGLDAVTTRIEIGPGATRVLEIDVGGPLAVDASSYRLTLPHQPLVNPDLVDVRVRIDGRDPGPVDTVVLTEDTVVGAGAS